MPDDEETPWFDTGPFCRHWGDPSDCDDLCANCGHKCGQHDQEDDGACNVEGCECAGWKDAEVRG